MLEMEDGETLKNVKDSSESENEDVSLRCQIRKNRRKNLMPQKAIQSDTNNSIPTNNPESTNSSRMNAQDTFTIDNSNNIINDSEDSSSISESEFLSNICNDEILRELQENPVNEELLKELNEEDIFLESKRIKRHICTSTKEEYHSYRMIKCNMCEQVYRQRTDFEQHYMENYNLAPVYTCTFCNKTCEKYSAFRSHCYRHITEGRFKCNNCSKGFNLKSLLHIHILAKHSKVKPFSCELCARKFVTKPGLRMHQKKHRTETREDYPCVICGKILHTRGGLTSHMNVHRLGRRFMCDFCGKTFTQKVNMQQHVKQHTGDKPHVCDKCGKTFVEKSHLSRHYSLHSEERPFKCDICQKMYKTERCLKVHSLVHASERPFICKFCNKGFLSSTKLKQHSNIHTGERPYSCKYCERTFTNYPNLLKHTRRKHKSEKEDDTISFDLPSNCQANNIEETLLSDENYELTDSGNLIAHLPMHQSLIQQMYQSNHFSEFSQTPN